MFLNNFISLAFSLFITGTGVIRIIKKESNKQKVSGIIILISGIVFIAASIMSLTGLVNKSDNLLYVQWALYLGGLIIFIIGMIIGKKKQK